MICKDDAQAEPRRVFAQRARRRVVENDFARAARFRRLARDGEHVASAPAGFRWTAFARPALRAVSCPSA
ncbi:MAG: hypothetical protein H7343_17620 [Undibacterium sp.]|nr:hypothetical protein [Opitutaceae bacterium]